VKQAGRDRTQTTTVFSARRLFWGLIATVFLGELLDMFVLESLPRLPPLYENLLDSTLLVLLTFPVLYFFLLRPAARQIADLHAVQAELQVNIERFRSLTELSADFYWETDAGHRLTTRTESQREITEGMFRLGTLIGQRRWEIPYLAPDEAAWRQHRAKLDAHEPFRDFEITRLRPNGKLQHISVRGDPVFDAAGKFTGYRGVGSDITDRKQATDALKASEERYRVTFDQIAVGIVHTSYEGKYQTVNQKFCEMLGYSEAELLGRAAADFAHPQDVDLGTQYREQLWSGKLDQFVEEKRYLRKDGSVIWTNRTVSLARDDSGHPLYFIRVIEDITARKEIEERYRATFENAPVGIMHTEIDSYRILRANPKLCEMLGYTEIELLGMTSTEVVHPDYRFSDRPAYMQPILNDERQTFASERKFLRKDGSTLWVNRTVSLVRNATGKPLYFIRIIEDITARKSAEAEISALNADLERRVAERTAELEIANRELNSFSYTVAHDMRAPVRAIHGFSEIVLKSSEGKLDESARGYLKRVVAGSLRMGALIDDLLDLARLSRQEMRRQDVNVTEMAAQIAAALAEAHPARGVAVTIQPGLIVNADPGLMRALLENLLGNAWKFTEKTQAARIEMGTDQRDGNSFYYVRDNGAGFDMQYAHKLFEPFQRLHHTNEFEGTGIGLATVKKIIQRHGGEVCIESKIDAGTTVFFALGQPA
jgi:PAS domain S-box-containing protein